MAVARDLVGPARWSRWLLAISSAVAVVGVSLPTQANHACVSYSVTSPVTSYGGTTCSPVWNPFTQPYTLRNCGYIPLLGATHCETVSLHTP
jgi:ABC-type multidrug transport system permease subunit